MTERNEVWIDKNSLPPLGSIMPTVVRHMEERGIPDPCMFINSEVADELLAIYNGRERELLSTCDILSAVGGRVNGHIDDSMSRGIRGEIVCEIEDMLTAVKKFLSDSGLIKE